MSHIAAMTRRVDQGRSVVVLRGRFRVSAGGDLGFEKRGHTSMGVREWLDKNQQAATVGSGAVVVFAVGLIIYQLLPPRPETKAWYTTDDGKTWFKDSNRLVAPFQKDGKEAVLAKVYECEGREFVAYMERYRPGPAKKMREFRAKEDAGEAVDDPGIGLGSVEYKRPGADQKWTTELHHMTDMMQVNCKDGNPAPIVFP